MVVDIHVEFKVFQPDVEHVNHWDKTVGVCRRTRRPVLAKISKHIDVIPQEEQDRFAEDDSKGPLSLVVPLQR